MKKKFAGKPRYIGYKRKKKKATQMHLIHLCITTVSSSLFKNTIPLMHTYRQAVTTECMKEYKKDLEISILLLTLNTSEQLPNKLHLNCSAVNRKDILQLNHICFMQKRIGFLFHCFYGSL